MKVIECLKRLWRGSPPPRDGAEAPLWHEFLEGEMGVAEIPGSRHNERILWYHSFTRLKATQDEIAWCSAIMNAAMVESGIQGTESAAARSWMNWGRACPPRVGAVAVFWRKSPDDWRGHVASYVHEDGEKIYVLGGNQGNKVQITGYPKAQLLGYRWPKRKE